MNEMRTFLFAFAFTATLLVSAEEKKLPQQTEYFKVNASQSQGALSPPPPVFAHTETSTFLPQIPKVNVVTGEYHEEEIDLIVAGCEPLSIRRFYSHLAHKNQAYGHWRINPESLMLFDFRSNTQKRFAGIGEENGNFILCEKEEGNTLTFDPLKHRDFTHTGRGHPLNTRFSFHYVKPGHRENYWHGVIEDGLGGKKTYSTEIGLWNQADANSFQACIKEERKPNGNIIYYEYEDFNRKYKQDSHYKNLDTYYILRSVSAYSSKGVPLGSVHLHYPDQVKGKKKDKRRYIHRVEITGSDKRKATLFNHIREVERKKKVYDGEKRCTRPQVMDVVLDHVETPSKPQQNYNYHWDKPQRYFDHPFMFYLGEPEGRILETTYDLNSKKVIAQSAPVGPNDTMCPIARYEYTDHSTTVYDGENNKTVYQINGRKRIWVIQQYDRERPVRMEVNKWHPKNGNLMLKQIQDGNGDVLHIAEYKYDENHNIIEESIGNRTKKDRIKRTFSDDGFNLKLTESDREGKRVCYAYIPNTNLLSSELTYAGDRIIKRIFHFYDEKITSVCVKTIVDDGCSKDPHDLTHVTYRKIFEVRPKRKLPCVGLPEEVLEKTLDSGKNEILLKKVRYTYHPSGKVAREDHYDANGDYRYCLLNEYDEKERLIAATDALGLRTTFSYDANFNLTSQKGPRADIRKKWSYDKVNRPIEEKEWQTDGTVLITKKKYDKCSRLISQIDPSGFETRYTYNALGKLTAILHPDGAVEKRAYDALGNMTKETDPNGVTTIRTYDFRNQPTGIYYADDRSEHFIYNENGGTLAVHIDPSCMITRYCYDIFDNLIKTEFYSSEEELLATTSATYSPFHKLSQTDAEGVTTYYTYDFAGRMVAEQTGERVITYAYDALGRLARTQEGDHITTNTYDVKGQLIEKRIIGLDDQEYFRETYAYDEMGNRTCVTTCAGVAQTAYNSRGDPIQQIDPLGNTTNTTYSYKDCFTKTTTNPKGVCTIEIHDARGRVIDRQVKNTSNQTIQKCEKRYDPAGNQTHSIEYAFEGPTLRETITHEWIYGPYGRIDQVTEAGEKTTRYLYDRAGRLITTIKPDGAELHNAYDARSRLSRYYGTDLDYIYTYDRKDRLLAVKDGVHKTITKRAYDIYDHLIEEQLASGLRLRSEYDPYGRRKTLYLPDGTQATFTHQGPYLHTVSRNGYTHTYTHNLAGKPTSITLPNRLGTLSLSWDPLLRWDQVRSPYYQANCTYDSVGNLTQYRYTDPLGSQENSYQYDDLDQLIAENTHTYRYDSLFNRTSKDDTPYSLNPLCQITHDGDTEYMYDKNGNLISDGEATYEYDLLDRLIAVTKNQKRTTYTYDPFNRRIAKDNDLYIWDDKNEIGISHNGWITELRILGEGLGAEIGSSVLFEINGYTYFPLHDIQGSLATLVYTNGRTYDTCRYTAFGELKTQAYYSPWRYAGKRYDAETDFIYFGRRYYSPKLGRWITADPRGFDDGPNLYAYVHNSPFTTLDLHGLFSLWNAWTGMKNFGGAAYKHSQNKVKGCAQSCLSASEWMGVDALYEMGEPTYFHQKSRDAYEGWKSLGSALYNDPWGTTAEMLVPGIRETFHNPTSVESWGKASVDILEFGIPMAKLGQVSKLTRMGRVGAEVSTVGKASRFARQATSAAEHFFESGQYSSKVLHQMGKADDIYHAFPTSVDGFATKFGKWSTKTGSNGEVYQWLEMHGSYRDKVGVFEFIKDRNGIINHRYFKTK